MRILGAGTGMHPTRLHCTRSLGVTGGFQQTFCAGFACVAGHSVATSPRSHRFSPAIAGHPGQLGLGQQGDLPAGGRAWAPAKDAPKECGRERSLQNASVQNSSIVRRMRLHQQLLSRACALSLQRLRAAMYHYNGAYS